MSTFEKVKWTLKSGQKIKVKLGRARGDKVDWEEPTVQQLYIQKHKEEIFILALDNENWAEYYPKNDYCGKNLFVNEDYYMEVIDWNIK